MATKQFLYRTTILVQVPLTELITIFGFIFSIFALNIGLQKKKRKQRAKQSFRMPTHYIFKIFHVRLFGANVC